jgi:hypothetical protein
MFVFGGSDSHIYMSSPSKARLCYFLKVFHWLREPGYKQHRSKLELAPVKCQVSILVLVSLGGVRVSPLGTCHIALAPV